MKAQSEELKKITVMIPASLLDEATSITGQGIAPTIRDGLTKVIQANAFEELGRLRGKVRLTIDQQELRQDRD